MKKSGAQNILDEKNAQKVADHLNPLIADAFSLYVKTKNFHWHVKGSHFYEYHKLFDEQAAQIFEMIDVLAERVRKLGKTTIRSIGQIQQLKTIDDNDADFLEPEQMIRELLQDNMSFAESLKQSHQICDKVEDVATASILEVYIDETERRAWFLRETIA